MTYRPFRDSSSRSCLLTRHRRARIATQFAVMSLNLQVRISSPGPGAVCFTVEGSTGEGLLSSAAFPTICRLEEVLAKLCVAASSPIGERSWQLGSDSLAISGPSGRLTLRLSQAPRAADIDAMLDSLPTAKVIDDRDPKRRRTDLSGPMRLLIG